MWIRPLGMVALCALSGCGGCGDDTAVEPDAEIVIDPPDAEVPDAAPTVVGPVRPRVLTEATPGHIDVSLP